MTPCEANRIVSETAYKASVPEDHKPKWESTDRRAFVSKKLRDSITDQILSGCRNELCKAMIDSPFRPISGELIEYNAIRYYIDGACTSFRETVNVVFYGKLDNMYIIWLTRNFPTFDIFGFKRQFNDWIRYEIYISENEMEDLFKVENRIRYEVGRFLDTFMSIENSDRKEEKEMHHRTHEEIVNEFKLIVKKSEDNNFKYKKFIFSGPATIILWEDGTKTVVKCSPGRFCDPYSGIAIAFMKKALGNGNGHRNKKIMNDICDALNAMKKKEEKNGKTENS